MVCNHVFTNAGNDTEPMETIDTLALMLGAAWASGINLYAAILVIGWLGGSGHVELPPDLQVLSNPMVLSAAGVMYAIEFFTDKVPGIDTGWDALHTFVRIPAGALMAAGAAQGLDLGQAGELVGLLLGGGVAATSHAAKAGSRVVINSSPEPFSNWGASVAEDVAVIGGLWTALNNPVVFLVLFAVFIVLAIWLLPKLWRLIRRTASAVGGWFSRTQTPKAPAGDDRNEIHHPRLAADHHPDERPTGGEAPR